MSETRPYESELNTLVGHIATALELPVETVVTMLEHGTLSLSMGADARGNRYVAVVHGEGADRREAHIYRDAIHHRGEHAPDGAASGPDPEAC